MVAKKGWSKKPVKKEEKVVETVVESNENVVEEAKEVIAPVEEKIVSEKILGEIAGHVVKAPKKGISFEVQTSSYPMFKLPADIQQYLINKGFGSNVYKRDKERLIKHGVDAKGMEMIEKLKKFLTGK